MQILTKDETLGDIYLRLEEANRLGNKDEERRLLLALANLLQINSRGLRYGKKEDE